MEVIQLLVKAGGNNPNETGTPDPYDPEETGVFELVLKVF